jgi:FkbM family methyltransferase
VSIVRNHYNSVAAARKTEWLRIQSQGHPATAHLGRGARILLYPDSVLSELLFRGDFELDEICFVGAYLRPGDVVVDAGANVGVYTVVAAQRVGARGRVYSFEPTPRTFRRLTENVSLNRFENVVCSQLGLSDAPELLELRVSADGLDAWNSFGTPAHEGVFSGEAVSVTAFNGYAREVGLCPGDVTLMKIDVEGWEERVLAGASDFLAHPNGPALVVETNDSAARSAGSSAEAILRTLRGFGYSLFRFDRLSRSPVRVGRGPSDLRDGNLVALKRPELLEGRLGGRISWRLRRPGHGLW